jgi:hypothetical protein
MANETYTLGYFGFLADDKVNAIIAARKVYSAESSSELSVPIFDNINVPQGTFFTPEEFYNLVKLPLGIESASSNDFEDNLGELI